MERRSAQLNAAWLVRRLKARDFSALELFFERYHRLVYGVALRILDQPAGAENLTHAVFLDVWKSPDSVPEHDLAGWLAEITRSRALRRPQSLAAATPAAKGSRLN